MENPDRVDAGILRAIANWMAEGSPGGLLRPDSIPLADEPSDEMLSAALPKLSDLGLIEAVHVAEELNPIGVTGLTSEGQQAVTEVRRADRGRLLSYVYRQTGGDPLKSVRRGDLPRGLGLAKQDASLAEDYLLREGLVTGTAGGDNGRVSLTQAGVRSAEANNGMSDRSLPATEGRRMTELAMSRAEAGDLLDRQLALADSLREQGVQNFGELPEQERQFESWNDFNRTLLESMFTDDSVAEEYERVGLGRIVMAGTDDEVKAPFELIDKKAGKLESVRMRLPLYSEQAAEGDLGLDRRADPGDGSVVFIVHGREHGIKEAVARFVEQLGLKAIVLHEVANRSRTVIEKLEQEAERAVFAVVVMTPDDEGRLREVDGDGKLSRRVRENVMFELGYFIGRLGRSNVAALLVDSTPRPTDLDGVTYIPVASIQDSGWRADLQREIEAAGLPMRSE